MCTKNLSIDTISNWLTKTNNYNDTRALKTYWQTQIWIQNGKVREREWIVWNILNRYIYIYIYRIVEAILCTSIAKWNEWKECDVIVCCVNASRLTEERRYTEDDVNIYWKICHFFLLLLLLFFSLLLVALFFFLSCFICVNL